uniref:Uncharacterized protein n=1 Tax=Arundo donax TaxID=35708 RepID=A0A0A9G3C5_ARUDO
MAQATKRIKILKSFILHVYNCQAPMYVSMYWNKDLNNKFWRRSIIEKQRK